MTKVSLERERKLRFSLSNSGETMQTRLTVIIFTFLLVPQFANASDKFRGEVFCFPAKKVPMLVDKLREVKTDRRDVVDVDINPKFLIKDGGDWPERFFLRTKTAEINVPIEKPSGHTPTFLDKVSENPLSDICVEDLARANRPKYDEGLYFEMGLSPLFHNRSGLHDISELEEGAKDGKAFYKKMIPGAVRIFMPDTNYLAVNYDDFRVSGAELFAQVNGEEIPVDAELFKEKHVISFRQLKEMGANALIIRGGAYSLQPTVSVDTMKRFGWGQEKDRK